MSTKDLKKVRKENDKLKGELSKITNEMGSLREQFKKFEQPHETSDDTLQELRPGTNVEFFMRRTKLSNYVHDKFVVCPD